MTDGYDISSEIAWWTLLDFSDDKSTLVQVMAWCCQATSHYLNQCWPRSLPPYGVSRPQWFNVKLNEQLNNQSSCQWFEMLWHSCGVTVMKNVIKVSADHHIWTLFTEWLNHSINIWTMTSLFQWHIRPHQLSIGSSSAGRCCWFLAYIKCSHWDLKKNVFHLVHLMFFFHLLSTSTTCDMLVQLMGPCEISKKF